MTEQNDSAKITANRTAIKPLQKIMAIAADTMLSPWQRVDDMREVATQGIVDIYKELNELADAGGANTLGDIIKRNVTSTQEGSYDYLKRVHPEFVDKAFAAAKNGEGDLPAPTTRSVAICENCAGDLNTDPCKCKSPEPPEVT